MELQRDSVFCCEVANATSRAHTQSVQLEAVPFKAPGPEPAPKERPLQIEDCSPEEVTVAYVAYGDTSLGAQLPTLLSCVAGGGKPGSVKCKWYKNGRPAQSPKPAPRSVLATTLYS